MDLNNPICLWLLFWEHICCLFFFSADPPKKLRFFPVASNSKKKQRVVLWASYKTHTKHTHTHTKKSLKTQETPIKKRHPLNPPPPPPPARPQMRFHAPRLGAPGVPQLLAQRLQQRPGGEKDLPLAHGSGVVVMAFPTPKTQLQKWALS